ncbi:MAG: hypothetical protein RLZZ344_1799 [Pseudomonadota bacterium]|jgi:uncharacterized protein YdiU (UPF0061 family)
MGICNDIEQQEIDGLGWQFDHSYARLPEVFFARVRPEPVSTPALVICNSRLASELGLDLGRASEASLAELFAGVQLPLAAEPIAQAYAGHQFGHFTMLGDGRAVLLGEQITPTGARYDLQFKGSGRTPFSRRGDGRAALGPMLREYLMSEAMHGLGIPTTRSLAVVGTGDWVYRDPPQPGAVLTRVAASHVRVGTFQFAAGIQRHQAQDHATAVSTLLRYAIDRHYPELRRSDKPALEFLKAVIDRQIALLAHWMRVGFIHGVMNTDNMAISGETIDYGPCAFMDAFDPDTVFSSIDQAGRYAFGNQPAIAQWNLARLAEALLTEIDPDTDRAIEQAHGLIESFSERYESAWQAMMRRKLGLVDSDTLHRSAGHDPDHASDQRLISDLLDWMQRTGADYSYTFWRLGCADQMALLPGEGNSPDVMSLISSRADAPFSQPEFLSWRHRWHSRLGSDAHHRRMAQQQMHHENPVVIPRNHRVEEALQAAVTDQNLGPYEALLAELQDPYAIEGKSLAGVVPGAPIPGYRTFCGT